MKRRFSRKFPFCFDRADRSRSRSCQILDLNNRWSYRSTGAQPPSGFPQPQISGINGECPGAASPLFPPILVRPRKAGRRFQNGTGLPPWSTGLSLPPQRPAKTRGSPRLGLGTISRHTSSAPSAVRLAGSTPGSIGPRLSTSISGFADSSHVSAVQDQAIAARV
jgi:hypothetical protein